MTDSTTTTRVSYTGDGTSVNFPITFPFYLSTDILVQLAGATIISGYSISGGSGLTGTLTMATPPAAGVNVQAILNPPLTQIVSLVDGTAFPSATLNQVNDRSVQIALRLQDQINRSIRAPDGDSAPVMLLPTATNRKNQALMFDANGNLALGVPNTQVITTSLLAPFLGLQQNAAEISAGVTPVNFAYPLYHAWRYGADPTGVADSTAALTNWLKVINQSGTLSQQSMRAAYLPGGIYSVTGPLPAITNSHLRIYGDGSDVSRIRVDGGSNSFTVLQIGNNMPTSIIVFSIQVEGIGIQRNSGSGAITLLKVINTQYSHYRDLSLYDNTGTTGGVGLFYAGHENNTFENLLIINVSPIRLGNPSGTAGDGCDHTCWNGLEIQSSNDTQALIEVVGSGTTFGNQKFVGNQVWLGGFYGFHWNDAGPGTGSTVGGNLEFRNIRREQTSGSSAGQTIYINCGTSDAITNISVRDSTMGLPTTLSGGLYFNGPLFVTLENVNESVPGVGVTMVGRANQAATQLTMINCNMDSAALALTNMEQVFGSNDLVLGSNKQPGTVIYQYTDVNTPPLRGIKVYEGRNWIGKRSSVVTAGAFTIPGTSTSVGIVTISASAGGGSIEGGTIICSGSATALVSGTANVTAAITAGKLSVTWNPGSNSYIVTNNLGSTRDITVSVVWM